MGFSMSQRSVCRLKGETSRVGLHTDFEAIKPTPEGRSETFQVKDLETGIEGPIEICTNYCNHLSSIGDVGVESTELTCGDRHMESLRAWSICARGDRVTAIVIISLVSAVEVCSEDDEFQEYDPFLSKRDRGTKGSISDVMDEIEDSYVGALVNEKNKKEQLMLEIKILYKDKRRPSRLGLGELCKTMSNEASTNSETPSLVLEDLEVSSDEDIFLNKNPTKRDLIHKMRRVIKKRVKKKKTEKQPEVEVEVDENWFSDDGENDEPKSLHGSKLILKKLEGSNPPIFDKMDVCLCALKNGFLSGCRPIISLDGCFLKTCYGGQLLVAVRRDVNDNMFPIAMVVVQAEHRENWTWFFRELLDDIGGLRTSMWSFISDRHKGLIEALKDLVSDF
ncbi:hypothetical protein Sango_2432500 [Sesamum angolense]|uniref:MULE transposase domain-containing protein n=1 Tax=Sesamum angolense TaxID=2727404 RepID=A0AAE1W7W3_9LAMI|nr:hypothetical protein Sango_2432500 [Sesamum angolense]